MLREQTVRQQILPVLRYVREHVRRGLSIAAACQAATRAVQKETQLTYQTIEDGCRRRLDLTQVRDFHELLAAWLHSESGELENLLLAKSDPSIHQEVREFFEDFDDPGRRSTGQSASSSNVSSAAASSSTGDCVITIDQLDAETVAVLRDLASSTGQSLEAQIRTILTRAARTGRSDLAMWAAGLRSRLRKRYVGDVTADIRADRQR